MKFSGPLNSISELVRMRRMCVKGVRMYDGCVGAEIESVNELLIMFKDSGAESLEPQKGHKWLPLTLLPVIIENLSKYAGVAIKEIFIKDGIVIC